MKRIIDVTFDWACMTEVKLPTKEELEKLYKEKGHDALVWYVWRNALRALPLFIYRHLVKIWSESNVRQVYVICRVSL